MANLGSIFFKALALRMERRLVQLRNKITNAETAENAGTNTSE
jgi:hypothetical protein